jgi:hypothetical protein
MLNARSAVAAHALSCARQLSLPILSASSARPQPARSSERQCYHRQPLQRGVHPSQSLLLPSATRGACGNASAHFARAFFKAFRPSPSFSAADPFANLQTNSRQLKKVLHDENTLYRSFWDDNPKMSRLANDLRLQILQGQDSVRPFSCVRFDRMPSAAPVHNVPLQINKSIAARLGNFECLPQPFVLTATRSSPPLPRQVLERLCAGQVSRLDAKTSRQ